MLSCVTVHYRVLQCVTVVTMRYIVLHYVTLSYSLLQHINVCYSVLQCVTVCYIVLHCAIVCYSVLHCVTLLMLLLLQSVRTTWKIYMFFTSISLLGTRYYIREGVRKHYFFTTLPKRGGRGILKSKLKIC